MAFDKLSWNLTEIVIASLESYNTLHTSTDIMSESAATFYSEVAVLLHSETNFLTATIQ